MQDQRKSEIVSTPNAPQAIGPYSQAVRYGDLLFVSGVLPIEPKTGALITGDLEAQCRQALDNLKVIIEAAGMTLRNVVKTSVFMKDLGDFAGFNEIYGEYFGDFPPARETVQVARLPRDASLEISAICGI